MIKNIKTAVILCGGKGTRLGIITKQIPKSLVKINNGFNNLVYFENSQKKWIQPIYITNWL